MADRAADLAAEFGDWLSAEGRATNTVAAYRRDVAAYLRWRDVRAGDDASTNLLADYVDELRTTRRPSSADRAVIALRIFHRWRDSITGDESPVPELAGVSRPTVERETPDLNEATVAMLLEATEGDTVERRRDAICIGLLYFAGLKASEAITLDLSDITVDGAVLTVDRDGAHERVLPAVPALQRTLSRWAGPQGRDRLRPTTDAVLVNRRGNRLTRQGLWLITGAVAARAGAGDALSPNALRRAAAAHLSARGVAPGAIAAFLGHTQRQAPGAGILNEVGWGSCNLQL